MLRKPLGARAKLLAKLLICPVNIAGHRLSHDLKGRHVLTKLRHEWGLPKLGAEQPLAGAVEAVAIHRSDRIVAKSCSAQ